MSGYGVRGVKKAVIISVLLVAPFAKNSIYPPVNNYKDDPSKVAIVTGATGNLGRSITYHLAEKKLRVIMACRDMERCKVIRREIVMLTGNKSVVCRQVDLENIGSINRFVDQIIKEEENVNILVNNAAVKNLQTRELNGYGIERSYFVNFLAPFLLTSRLLPKMEETAKQFGDARIINMIGPSRRKWELVPLDINFEERKYSAKAAYRQSKLALAYYTVLLNKFCREKVNRVFVYGVNPGYAIYTSFSRPSSHQEFLESMLGTCSKLNASNSISGVIMCALDPTMDRVQYSGKNYGMFRTHWGWGIVDKDEDKAKSVWNAALKTILLLPDEPPKH